MRTLFVLLKEKRSRPDWTGSAYEACTVSENARCAVITWPAKNVRGRVDVKNNAAKRLLD